MTHIARWSFVVLLAVSFCFNSYGAQPVNRKGSALQKRPAPAGFQNAAPGAGLAGRVQGFLNGLRGNPSKTKISQTSQAMPASLFTHAPLALPLKPPPASVGTIRTIRNATNGTPALLEVSRDGVPSARAAFSRAEYAARSMQFLTEQAGRLGISDPNAECRLESVSEDHLGMAHVRYQQTYRGVEVWGKELYVHVDNGGRVSSLTGNFMPSPTAVTTVHTQLSNSDAVKIAVDDLRAHGGLLAVPEQLARGLSYSGPSGRKIIWYDDRHLPRLAWFVEVRSGISGDWYYFIDGRDGSVLDAYNNVRFDGPTAANALDLNGQLRAIGTYQRGTTYFMIDASQSMFDATRSHIPDTLVGAICSLDLRNDKPTAPIYYVVSSTNEWYDPAPVSANYNAAVTYQFYRTVFSRNSIDNAGMTIYSIVHVADQSTGESMENAFWNGFAMYYGDGGTVLKPLAGALDVATHEMTHGVTERTANMVYKNQPGALNESMSDVFAVLLDSANWTIGEQVVNNLSAFPSGALRDLSSPHNGSTQGQPGWQPASMSEFVTTTGDNGGVHVNSGIPNHAFYLVAANVGRPRAGQIWYRALTDYLTRSSEFLDARIATEKSASDLYGAASDEVTAVKNAWDAVGVLEGVPPGGPPSTTLVGANWILATNTDPNDTNSLYMAKSVIQTGSDMAALTKTPVLTRPAVSDTSGIILFVDKSNNLMGMSANPQNPGETLIDGNGIWWSVAVGPGLHSLALTSVFVDTTIYYFDLTDTSRNRAFKIHTPSYDGANTQTALYADALSFDPTGRYLLFDSYNQMERSSGGVLDFWSINLLDVESGEIGSVFPPQPEGINVGNPAFAKTSASRFAFDYFDTGNNLYAVLAADFNTGHVGTVADSNRTFGFPTYAGNDSSIAYHTNAYWQSAWHDAIQKMPLQGDYISGTHQPQGYMYDATFPVWFVIGSRVTGVEEGRGTVPEEISLMQNYPNPFNPSTTIRYDLRSISRVSLKVYNVLGQVVATLAEGVQEPGRQAMEWNASNVPSGVYFYRLQVTSTSDPAITFTATKKMLLMK